MNAACPHCHANVPPGANFCPECGQATFLAPPNQGSQPIPAPAWPTARRKHRPWYRRKRIIIPLVLVVLVGVGVAGTLAYLNARFDDVNSISTPPPELSSDRLGGEEGVTIDTSAAQEAVREAQQREEREEESQLANNDAERPDEQSPGQTDVAARGGSAPSAAASPQPDTPQSTPRSSPAESVTILLMGVDARPGEAIDVGVRPDTLAVLHLDGDTGSCRLLSVPRDTRTELPGYGQSKVNHALAVGGIPYQELVTQNLLSIEIDHYGLIDFSGITGLVDAVGGVTVINDDAFAHLGFTFEAGEITLGGDEALAFARYRGGSDGDFGRIDRQQQIVRALINQTSGMDVVTDSYNLLGAVEGHVKTDLSITDLIGLADDYRSTCTEATLELDNLDGAVATYPDPLLNMELSYVTVAPEEIEQKVDWLRGEP